MKNSEFMKDQQESLGVKAPGTKADRLMYFHAEAACGKTYPNFDNSIEACMEQLAHENNRFIYMSATSATFPFFVLGNYPFCSCVA